MRPPAWTSSAFCSLSREIPSPAESFRGRLANGLSEKGVGFSHKAQRGVGCAWINLFETEGLGSFTVCEETFRVWIETSNGVVLGCDNVLGRCPGLLKTDLKFSSAALVGSAHTDKKIRILKAVKCSQVGSKSLEFLKISVYSSAKRRSLATAIWFVRVLSFLKHSCCDLEQEGFYLLCAGRALEQRHLLTCLGCVSGRLGNLR